MGLCGNDRAPWPLSWVLFQALRREKVGCPHVGPKVKPAVVPILARQGKKIGPFWGVPAPILKKNYRPKIGPLGAAFPPPRGVFLGQAPGAKAAFF